jgi:hypothetical protein
MGLRKSFFLHIYFIIFFILILFPRKIINSENIEIVITKSRLLIFLVVEKIGFLLSGLRRQNL